MIHLGVKRSPIHRLRNNNHLSFEGCEAVDMIQLLDQAGLECSACMAGKIRPSHVQLAMGLDGARGRSSLRFSFSILNTPAEAHNAAEIVIHAVKRLRGGNSGVMPTACGVSLG